MFPTARQGLRLIEVLVVLGIVFVALALFLPKARDLRGLADSMKCRNNFKGILLGILKFESNSSPNEPLKGWFPTGCIGPGTNPEDRLSWMVSLLPYVEEGNLYKQLDCNKDFANNQSLLDVSILSYVCPSDNRKTESPISTNYIAMAGLGLDAPGRLAGAWGHGFMGYDRLTSFESITDGISNTIAVMETHTKLEHWARGGPSNLRGFDPTDLPLTGERRPFYTHENRMLVGKLDGSVREISANFDPTVLAAAITIAGAERERWGSSW
jgi:hypothetical protein